MGGGRNTGGFAERFRGSGNLAVKIPDSMNPADAAPLLCAGITVWSPIKKYVTRPGMKVCIICVVNALCPRFMMAFSYTSSSPHSDILQYVIGPV